MIEQKIPPASNSGSVNTLCLPRMSYCLNPNCQKPHNLAGTNFCISCGTKLLLKDRYLAIQPLGEGGFGRTFLAEDALRLNARCVIKQFSPLPQIQGNSAAMAKATQLFEQEARQLLKLGEQHPQIPTLFAYFEQDKRLYLVQQYIEGQDLWQELEQQRRITALPCPYSEQQIRELLLDILPVLEFIHEHQVVHRDIKPTNIIRRRSPPYQGWARGGQLVLIDFGISKQLTGSTGLTRTGTKAGTEGYAPIEQIRSGKAYPASDLYSLGVTCIHLLTAAELDELYDPLEGCWVWKEYLRKKGKDVSDQLSQILDKLLKDFVKERYQSASVVLQDLNAAYNPLLLKPQPKTPAPAAPLPKPTTWQCVRILMGHSNPVPAVAISPDGQTLVSGSEDKTIKIWQLDSGKLIHTLTAHSGWVNCIAISPDGQTLVSGCEHKTIKIWHLASGELIHTLTGHSGWVRSVAISPDGQTIASASGDKTIKIWHLASGQLIHTFTGHSGYVDSVAFSPDGQTLVSSSWDNTIKIWQLPSGKLLHTLSGNSGGVFSVAFSPDGQTLVSGNWDKTIEIWQLPSGKLINTLLGHSREVTSVAISRDGQMLVSGSRDESMKIWHLPTGKLTHTLIGHSISVRSVAISPDGQTIASASGDKTIRLWRCDRG